MKLRLSAVRFFKADDGVLDILQKMLALLGVVFGVWVYFHTIYPVFTKEEELLDAKSELRDVVREASALKAQTQEQRHALQLLDEQVRSKEQQIVALNSSVVTLQTNLRGLSAKAEELSGALETQKFEAVRAHVLRMADQISRDGILAAVQSVYGGRNEFDLRRAVLSVVKDRSSAVGLSEAEGQALKVLELYASEHLSPNDSDYSHIFNIIIFMVQDEKAIRLMRGEARIP